MYTLKSATLHSVLAILLTAFFSPVLLRAQDRIPPSAPSDLIATAACGQVSLSWSGSADEAGGSGLRAYIVQRWENGKLQNEAIVGASHTSFTDTNRLTPSTALTYTVVAIDRAGNRSAASNAVTVGISPCSGSANTQITGDFSGELEVAVEDGAQGSRTLYTLKTANERLSLHFAGNPPRGVVTGAHAHIKGVLSDRTVTVASGDTGVEILAFAISGMANMSTTSGTSSTSATNTTMSSANTFGEQKTLVMLVNFQNDPANRPWTLDQVRSVYGAVSNFYMENSYNQTWLTTDVVGWYVVPLDNSSCDNVSSVAAYANAAATGAGVTLAAYTHYVYVMPWVNCTWVGLSLVGGSQSWINQQLTLGVTAHEMGHNLGLHHSHSWVCNNTGDTSGTTAGPYCFGLEYGDGVDTMGWSKDGPHFNSFAKEYLGWLNYGVSPPITTVQASGTYTLAPYETTGSKPKALKILKSVDPTTGHKTWYYIEYRQATGFDSYLATVNPLLMNGPNILNGVLVRTGELDESSDTGFLLDMTPATYQLYTQDPALDVGNTFSDPAAGVTITTQWVNSTSAGVTVTLSQPCVRANPAISFSPSSQSAQPGASLTYTVSLTNKDSSNCGPSSFSLQTAIPAGWAGALSASALAVSPAASATTTLTVTSPSTASASTYSIGVTAASTTGTATATAAYSVLSSLVTSVSTDKTAYTRGNTVTITDVTKTSGGTPVATADVTVTVTKPNGSVVTQSAVSDSTGTVKIALKTSRKDPAGTWQVVATAASNGVSAKATTTFTVQ